jgi:ribosomal protein L7/L12
MKLTISISEVKALVSKTLNLPADVMIDIVDVDTGDFDRARAILQEVGPKAKDPSKKIAAIKQLRTLVPGLGLIDAKFIVENWDKVANFIYDFKRLPRVSGNWGDVMKLV